MNANSLERLNLVHPRIAYLIGRLDTMLSLQGVHIEVVQGLRSWNEQEKLYQQGRTLVGSIITNCPAGHSWHNFGLAVDIAPFENNIPDWDIRHPMWNQMIVNARSLGFTCGADFRTFPDNPHLQLTGKFPVNPNDEVRQLFKDGGIIAVWDEAHIGE